MGISMNFPKILILIILFFIPLSDVAAQNYLDLGVGYVSGDFNTGVNSNLSAVTAELGYFGSENFFSAATSYLNLDTDGLDQQKGMGDTYLEAGYIYRSQNNNLRLLPSVTVKLPTADETKNLGSGETDIGAFLDIYKKCGSIICTVDLGYIFVGDPPGIDYNNILKLSVGGFVKFQQAGVTTYIQYNSAILDGRTDPIKLGIDWFYLFNLKTALYIDGIAGLNDAAPDYGIRTGIIKWF